MVANEKSRSSFQCPLFGQESIVAIRKVASHSTLSVSQKLPTKQFQCLFGRTLIVPDLGGWNIGNFLSLFLFPSGDKCCGALACLYSKLPQASKYLECDYYYYYYYYYLRRANCRPVLRSSVHASLHCLFIPSDSRRLCMPIPDSACCSRFIESVKLTAWAICGVSRR